MGEEGRVKHHDAIINFVSPNLLTEGFISSKAVEGVTIKALVLLV